MTFLHRQLAVYAAFHRNPINKLTHAVGVPAITLAIMIGLGRAGLLTAFLIVYLAPILLMDPLLGGALAAILAGLGLLAQLVLAGTLGAPGRVAAWLFVGGWALQFLGHGFEGRRPAFLQNAVQILVAPPFLVHELLVLWGRAAPLVPDAEA